MSVLERKLGFTETKRNSDVDPETGATSQYADFNSTEVIELAKTNMDFLAGLALPDIYKYAFPAVFLAIWAWVLDHLHKVRDFSQLAIGLPRGFGKTLVIKLVVLYAILFTKKQFILIFSENEQKAISIISDVMDMLSEPNIKSVFGDWTVGKEVDQQAKKVFGFRGRTILLKAAGAGTGIRGITEKNKRPDLMVFDDIQSREDSESEILSANLEKWMVATAMKAKSPEGCLFLFIANMYPTKGSLLRKLKRNKNWVSFIAGGILANGESLWEDLQPISQLLREFQNDLETGHPEIFYAEVLNDENASVNTAIDLAKIPPYDLDSLEIPVGKYILIDPANNKTDGDAVAIGYFEVYDGYPCAREIVEENLSPENTILKAIELCLKWSCYLVVIEANAFQYTLQFWFNFICNQRGISGIQVRDIYSGMISKQTRILSMFKQLSSGEIILHPDVRSQVFVQVMQFNPLRTKGNVDGILDLLTYAPRVLEMYGPELSATNIIDQQEYSRLEVVDDNCVF